jgi:hypothetical protein
MSSVNVTFKFVAHGLRHAVPTPIILLLMADSILHIDCKLNDCTTINDLPTKLLDAICNYVKDDDSLIALASLCTQLNTIALPIYFTCIRFDGSSLCMGYPGGPTLSYALKVLKGMCLSLALAPGQKLKKGLTTLKYQFTGDTTNDPFTALITLLDDIPYISSVDLHLGNCTYLWPEFYPLMQALGGKSCTSLKITHFRHQSPAPSLATPLPNLKTLYISGLGFSPIFQAWVISIMNSSPLRVLELELAPCAILKLFGSTVQVPYLT